MYSTIKSIIWRECKTFFSYLPRVFFEKNKYISIKFNVFSCQFNPYLLLTTLQKVCTTSFIATTFNKHSKGIYLLQIFFKIRCWFSFVRKKLISDNATILLLLSNVFPFLIIVDVYSLFSNSTFSKTTKIEIFFVHSPCF